MKVARRVVLGILLLAGAVPAFGADLPTAESVLDRFVEVTGGKAAYENRKTEIVHGTVEIAAMGLKGTMTEFFAEPGKYYTVMDLAGVGKIESGVTGGVAWENTVLLGARIKTGEEKAQSVREADMNGVYHWRDLYSKAEVAGEETVDGEACYKLVMTPAEGKPETMYFEKQSGLMRKTTVVAASQYGDIPAESISTQYRRFEDILAPSKVTGRVAGQELIITIESAQANREIPPETFALPDEVKALLAKQKK